LSGIETGAGNVAVAADAIGPRVVSGDADQRALAAATLRMRWIRLFLTKRSGKRAVKLEHLRAEDVLSLLRQETLSKPYTWEADRDFAPSFSSVAMVKPSRQI
jgi:hypothetical protein